MIGKIPFLCGRVRHCQTNNNEAARMDSSHDKIDPEKGFLEGSQRLFIREKTPYGKRVTFHLRGWISTTNNSPTGSKEETSASPTSTKKP